MNAQCNNVSKLWTQVNVVASHTPPGISRYDDKNWLKGVWYNLPEPDYELLATLCWGPWPDKRSEDMWSKIKSNFARLSNSLDDLSSDQITSLGYPLHWQKEWLIRMVQHLKDQKINL